MQTLNDATALNNGTAVDLIRLCEAKALENEALAMDEAVGLISLDSSFIYDLIASSNRVRRHYKGDTVSLCSIINAKSGKCAEDCAFCSQSVHASGKIEEFDLVSPETIINGAREAIKSGAHKYGIVTSGYGFNEKSRNGDLESIIQAIENIKENLPLHRCASLGVIDRATALRLKEAGIVEYHHNLETARSFFPNICSTHEYDEDVETVRAVKSAGMKVCCGGIFGMGESLEQRVEMAFELKELDVDSVPLNFLNPIDGTRLSGAVPLKPLDVLKIISTYRMILPTKDIKVAGGREKNLRDLQCLMFAAGANSTMVGNYLTTAGRPAGEDLRMIKDLELKVKECD